jgi:hypothetical protein
MLNQTQQQVVDHTTHFFVSLGFAHNQGLTREQRKIFYSAAAEHYHMLQQLFDEALRECLTEISQEGQTMSNMSREEDTTRKMTHTYDVCLSGTQAIHQHVTIPSEIALTPEQIARLAIAKAQEDGDWEAGDIEPIIDVDEIKEGDRDIEIDGDDGEGKALEDILDVRGTAATNGELRIERLNTGFGGGYKVHGTSFAFEEFPSWDSLATWAGENKVDLASGWRPVEPSEDDDDDE